MVGCDSFFFPPRRVKLELSNPKRTLDHPPSILSRRCTTHVYARQRVSVHLHHRACSEMEKENEKLERERKKKKEEEEEKKEKTSRSDAWGALAGGAGSYWMSRADRD